MYYRAGQAGHDVAFQWLPSDCGIVGNERLDAAARSARHGAVTVRILFPRTDAARTFRVLARETSLRERFSEEFTCARIAALDALLQRPLPLSLSRCGAALLCRFWLRVAFTNAYSLIGMAESDECEV